MRTAIYCRVSTPGQKNTTSLPEQERINREKAASLAWEVSEPHVYREVEGGEDLYRPQMDKLWEAIMRHEVEGVIADVLDRLSRDEGDAAAFWHHCDRYGVVVELASEDLDDSEQGRTVRFIAGMHARMERADIKRRTQRGRRARAAAGKLGAAPFPLYGYLWGDPEKGQRSYYVVDPETSWVVVIIFERVAGGVPLRRICRQLEAEGIPTPGQVLERRGQLPRGKTASAVWHKSTIQRMIKRTPAYWGANEAYRYETSTIKERPALTGITRKRRQTRERAPDDPLRVAFPATTAPAIVSPELAARARARIEENHAEWSGRPVADPLATIWRGLAVCGHCGARLRTAQLHGSANRRYTCQGMRPDPITGQRSPCPGGAFTMSAGQLDPAGWRDVLAWLVQPENVERFLAEWQDDSAGKEESAASRLTAVEHAIAELRRKMKELGEDIAETTRGESRRTLNAQLDEYADQLDAEEGKRAKLLRETADAGMQSAAAAEFRDWAREVAPVAAGYDRAQQRSTLRALGAELTLWSASYVHPDGWPQRYKIRLHFTGWTGQAPVQLPPTASALKPSLTASCWLQDCR
jgi:site-specific DNA recombinase